MRNTAFDAHFIKTYPGVRRWKSTYPELYREKFRQKKAALEDFIIVLEIVGEGGDSAIVDFRTKSSLSAVPSESLQGLAYGIGKTIMTAPHNASLSYWSVVANYLQAYRDHASMTEPLESLEEIRTIAKNVRSESFDMSISAYRNVGSKFVNKLQEGA